MAVEGGGVDGDVGMRFIDGFDAFGRGNEYQRFDIFSAFRL